MDDDTPLLRTGDYTGKYDNFSLIRTHHNIETGTVIATESGFYDMSGIVEYPPGSGTLVVDLRHNHCGGKLPCTEGKPGEMEYSSTSTDGESPQPALSRRV